jgi:NAD(P)-dependent dehydrogenase (short-subunit alcohol dehydrogenase family)
LVAGAIFGSGLIALSYARRSSRYFDLKGRTVAITGGSRGLGLVMAREYLSRGARVAVCARDAEEVGRAVAELSAQGEIFGMPCDVTVQNEAEGFITAVSDRFGGIDVLVNNAGVIQVGPLVYQTQKDFEDAMKIHFWAPYYTMQAVLPEMRNRRSGRIVNVSSIGGRVAVPHLAPYCASKFALRGLSGALRNELVKENIYITTAFPGLMRTGSHINALFKGNNETEFALFSIMNGLPVSSINAERAARKIIDASVRGSAEVVVSVQAKIADALQSLAPELMSDIMTLTDRLLPERGGIGTGYAKGSESSSEASPSILTTLIDQASEENNEIKGRAVGQ